MRIAKWNVLFNRLKGASQYFPIHVSILSCLFSPHFQLKNHLLTFISSSSSSISHATSELSLSSAHCRTKWDTPSAIPLLGTTSLDRSRWFWVWVEVHFSIGVEFYVQMPLHSFIVFLDILCAQRWETGNLRRNQEAYDIKSTPTEKYISAQIHPFQVRRVRHAALTGS
jgi:hypothetical protein